MPQDTFALLVSRLLQKNKIAFDKPELSFQIQSHPSYPSLHAITGVLDHFKIENVAASIPTDEASLKLLPDTFMAQLEHKLVVATRKEEGIEVYEDLHHQNLLRIDEFLEKFTGIVVAVAPTEASEENAKKSKSSNLWAGALGLILLATLLVSDPAPANLIFLALGLCGLGLSIAILKQEFGMSSALGNAFCSAASDKKDCDAVLKSKAATLLGAYKFSDLSLVYFLSLSLFSFFNISFGQSLVMGHYLSLLTIPITLFSIYYQGFVIKKWCLLCLSVVAVLWLQTGVAIVSTGLNAPFEPDSTLWLALFGVAALAGWAYLKPKIEEFKDNQKTRIDFYRFKRNFELFSTLLHQTEAIDTAINAETEIVFGNENANTNITIVTNPFCGHCRPVHTLIEDILGQYPDLVKVVIRFNIVNPELKDSDLVRITTSLLEIYEIQGKDLCLLAMSDIYGGMLSTEWYAKWSDCTATEHYLNLLKKGSNWCNDHKINFTPVILINGRKMPESYERTDLIFFIEDLHESSLHQVDSETETAEALAVN